MRIGLVSTLATPVREVDTGSIEGLIWTLARELTRIGHEVTVFAAEGSDVDGRLVVSSGTYDSDRSYEDWQLSEWVNLSRAVELSADFDVLHSHCYLWSLAVDALSFAPMVHTMHTLVPDGIYRLWKERPQAIVTGISHFQWSEFDVEPAAVIHHGVDPNQLPFQGHPDDYVCYLGRFLPQKGAVQAIETARALGLRLVLSGPADENFRDVVEPLVDGRTVEYAGYLTGAERAELLGHARALLYPIAAPEPFGLVMPEAMMCGTPVVANALGAVPEIVDTGVTGYTARSPIEFERALMRSFALDRSKVRAQAEQRFRAQNMVARYARLYERVARTKLGLAG